jgi:hypothetical protein
MAQVFRTCCRQSYSSSGAGGLLRLWMPALWDWAWSAAGEWFSSLFRRSKMYNIHPWRASSQLIPLLFFLNACLALVFANPCTLILGDPLFTEYCALVIDNQSGRTLHVTPVYDNRGVFSAVRLYRTGFPISPVYRQRNIAVNSGEQTTLSRTCDQEGLLELYICDPGGECYVKKHLQVLGRMTINSLDGLSRPEAALEAAVGTFPEHDTQGLRVMLFCTAQIVFIIGAVYALGRSRTVGIPKNDF